MLSHLQEPIWHRRGSRCHGEEPRSHGLEVMAAIEAVLQLGQVTWDMLLADGMAGARNGVLDVAEQGVGPVEPRVLHAGTPTPGDVALVNAGGVSKARKQPRPSLMTRLPGAMACWA